MNELVVQNEYNVYPEVIQFDTKNPTLRSPYAPNDLPFYQTRETLMDVDTFRNFLKNAESRFRASKEYKAYKSYLIEHIGIDRCQIFGNINVDDADIEMVYVKESVPENASFGIHVSGDSMEPRFHNGDLVWVEKKDTLNSGEIGVFYLDGNIYIKRLEYGTEEPCLKSLNKKFFR